MAKDTSTDKENIKNDEEDNNNNKDISIDSLEEKIESLEKDKEEINTQLLRLQADFINYRNRMTKEKENSIAYGTEIIVSELLPVIDNFHRALEADEGKEDNNLYQGIKMIQKQLMDVLEKNSVVEIEAIGTEFDPNYHHAVVMEESDEYDSNLVIDVLQKGYMLKDKVIRPAMVKVSK